MIFSPGNCVLVCMATPWKQLEKSVTIWLPLSTYCPGLKESEKVVLQRRWKNKLHKGIHIFFRADKERP